MRPLRAQPPQHASFQTWHPPFLYLLLQVLLRGLKAGLTTTTTQTNGGGNTPQGTANGVPTVTTTTNPAGHLPPGQNTGGRKLLEVSGLDRL